MAQKEHGVSLTYVMLCLVILGGIGYLIVSAFKNNGIGAYTGTTREGSVKVTVTDGITTELLRGAVPAGVPVDGLTVNFADGEIKISGRAAVGGILTAAVVEGYPDLGAIKAILPDYVSLAATFAVRAGDDGVDIQPTGFYLAGYRIPLAFLPSGINDALNSAINSAVGDTGLKIVSIIIGDGSATITAE